MVVVLLLLLLKLGATFAFVRPVAAFNHMLYLQPFKRHTSHVTRHTSHVTRHAAHLSTFDMQVEAGLHCSCSMAAFTSRDSATLWLMCISTAWGEDRGSSWASKHLQARALVQRAVRLHACMCDAW